MSTYPARTHRRQAPAPESGSGAFWAVAALLLGLTRRGRRLLRADDVGRRARLARRRGAARCRRAGCGARTRTRPPTTTTALPLASFAGVVPDNAAELAEAHKPYDATLPPIPAGDLVKVHMTLKDMTVEIAPGVKYNTWAFDGHGAPGPVVHVREGQTVEMTLTNGGAIPHSIDFHAARIAPNVAFKDVAPGESFTFRFTAERPRRLHVPLRHEAGARAHRERDVRRDRRPARSEALPPVDNEYVLVAQRVVPERRRDRRARLARHGEGTRDDARLDDLQRLREPVRHASADRRSGRDHPLLGRRRRPDARHELPRRRHDASIAPG